MFSNSLTNKQYYILNKKYSKEEYFLIQNQINSNKSQLFDKYMGTFKNILKMTPKKALNKL